MIAAPALAVPAWSAGVRRPRVRLLQAALFAFFVFDGYAVPGLPVPIPGADLAAIVLVALGAFRVRERFLGPTAWYVPLWVLLVAYLALESWVNEVDWFRRAVRLGIMVVLSVQLGTGRLDLRSGLLGLLTGLGANAVLFYLRLAPDTYSGVLTGFLGDKNVAGLYYALVPLLALPFIRSRRRRVGLLVFASGLTYLTGSRTSIAALALAGLWVLLRKRLPTILHVPVLGGLYLADRYAEENFANALFSDREGSDLLRSRIGEAASEKAASAPPYGLGLGQATVEMDNRSWFFHDSFLALYVEGGWVALLVVVGLFAVLGLPLFTAPSRRPHLAFEAGTVVVMTCASKLGEVFLSLPAFLLLGCLLMAHALRGSPEPTAVAAGEPA
ncbi:hypothetical protein [Sinomonas sp. ASV322]|uniref:hypothetical protein n=1 Tax=Sinomonas sp. ASV322 TaxID=3041920 RepID=UPI0027DD7AAF|nr:hypothetical protein [Sinomonas sp. ASV322]MDQ4501907.1 hypothetical protein [Sinomonas sp. ASV322]